MAPHDSVLPPSSLPLQSLLDISGDAVALLDGRGQCVEASQSFLSRAGLPHSTLQRLDLAALIGQDSGPFLRGELPGFHGELAVGAAANQPLRLSRLENPVAGGSPWFLLELLPQRVQLHSLEEILQQRFANGATLLQLSLLHLDLVRGKLGIDAAEALHDQMGHRLGASLPAGSFYALQGGDRLLALTPGRLSVEEAREMAGALLDKLETPISIAEQVIEPSLSVGVSRCPDDGIDFPHLLDSSTQALQETQRPPFSSCCVAMPVTRTLRMTELLAKPLARAIEENRLELAFQPILELRSGRVTAAEVLCRWDDPELGRQSPFDFIDVAEATQQISSLGKWVMETAFSQFHRWEASGLRLARIGLNISPLQLQDPAWTKDLLVALERHQLSPERIVLELTEGDVLEITNVLADQIRELRRMGFILCLDDFGTGYSGLQRLTKLPFNQVKVDRSLISAIDYDQLQQAMLSAVISLGNASSLDVVVEGVERSRQLQILISLGVHLGQGYHLSAPLSAGELQELLVAQADSRP